jgi:hypothetical protein
MAEPGGSPSLTKVYHRGYNETLPMDQEDRKSGGYWKTGNDLWCYQDSISLGFFIVFLFEMCNHLANSVLP